MFVFRSYFQKNELVWRIGHTALILQCFRCFSNSDMDLSAPELQVEWDGTVWMETSAWATLHHFAVLKPKNIRFCQLSRITFIPFLVKSCQKCCYVAILKAHMCIPFSLIYYFSHLIVIYRVQIYCSVT